MRSPSKHLVIPFRYMNLITSRASVFFLTWHRHIVDITITSVLLVFKLRPILTLATTAVSIIVRFSVHQVMDTRHNFHDAFALFCRNRNVITRWTSVFHHGTVWYTTAPVLRHILYNTPARTCHVRLGNVNSDMHHSRRDVGKRCEGIIKIIRT